MENILKLFESNVNRVLKAAERGEITSSHVKAFFRSYLALKEGKGENLAVKDLSMAMTTVALVMGTARFITWLIKIYFVDHELAIYMNEGLLPEAIRANEEMKKQALEELAKF